MKEWVYVITNEAHPGLVKIGFSTKDPEHRARGLGTGSPFPFFVRYKALVDEGQQVELAVHKRLDSIRENKDREWFRYSVEEAIIAIKQVALGSLHFEEYSDPTLETDVANWGKSTANQKLAIGVAFSLLIVLGGYAFHHFSRQQSEPPKIVLAEHLDLERNQPREGKTSVIPNTTPARTPTPTPSAPPTTPRPVPTGEAALAAQQRAVRKFPQLGVKDSQMNRAFLEHLHRHQTEKPEIFDDPDWATKVATEAAASLK